MAVVRLEELQNARAKALRSVLRPDVEYFLRKLCRWAVDALGLSIYEAQKMPLDQLLRHYYEVKFEGVDDEQMDKVIAEVLKTKEQAKREEQEEVVDDEDTEDFVEMVRREAEELARKRGDKVLSREEAEKAKKKAKKGNGIKFNFGPPPGPPQDASPLTPPGDLPVPNLADLPEDVSVRFEGDDMLSDEDWDLLGIAKPKK